MSGGVDSSVTAALLTQKDYDLSAVFMRNWDTRDEHASDIGCEWEKDWEDVQRVCKVLDIPCQLVDFSKLYWTRVFEPALEEWSDGSSPNPDISCNREIKFGALTNKLLAGGAHDYVATGHYAQVSWTDDHTPRPRLFRSADPNKDQTYYLSSVSETALRQTLFPIGNLTKPEVRALAHKYELPTASRDESMGICFVGQKQNFNDFLGRYIPPNPGNIVDLQGNVLGRHSGLWSLTIGQSARISGRAAKMYTARKDPATNSITVVEGNNHPMLMCQSLVARDWHWVWNNFNPLKDSDRERGRKVTAQIRHRMKEAKAELRLNPNTSSPNSYEVIFDEPQHAVAEGQIVVLWDGPWCLGSARIDSVRTLAD